MGMWINLLVALFTELILPLLILPALHEGRIADYAALARLGHVSRARISQIMNLLLLAPDIQEALLFLADTQRGRDRIHLRALQDLAKVPDWQRQRHLWQALSDRAATEPSPKSHGNHH